MLRNKPERYIVLNSLFFAVLMQLDILQINYLTSEFLINYLTSEFLVLILFQETLRKAEEIFGTDNKDLYLSFQGLLNRNIH